ncbi:MAG: hypothetical protein RIC03_06995 [Cyclobacteriaceae bacterium]
MSYMINGNDLYDFGFTPGQAPESNCALAGAWDLPARMGKLYHDWGDSQGIEPYVDKEDIRFGGRDLKLYGSIFGENEIATYQKLTILEAFLKVPNEVGFKSLTCDFGEFYINVISVSVIRTSVKTLEMVINFREPVVSFIPPPTDLNVSPL